MAALLAAAGKGGLRGEGEFVQQQRYDTPLAEATGLDEEGGMGRFVEVVGIGAVDGLAPPLVADLEPLQQAAAASRRGGAQPVADLMTPN